MSGVVLDPYQNITDVSWGGSSTGATEVTQPDFEYYMRAGVVVLDAGIDNVITISESGFPLIEESNAPDAAHKLWDVNDVYDEELSDPPYSWGPFLITISSEWEIGMHFTLTITDISDHYSFEVPPGVFEKQFSVTLYPRGQNTTDTETNVYFSVIPLP